ncbi:hypothetical protein Misp01_83420 [Microtetraspora sp. NBRC 13810]|uniref:DUF4192 domain-containing protein n=1 Tax=Microtetraspora sp. NBRC 13810 TaxID=3030990 RepID=UPI0024A0D3EF|nr:DUF4192 domain-containing protein [Microtetraspora sp. NBRC 13810]GLW13214.1 hypothetical protein Misp01_83420 [Microtetraspora sp. NBRC 13810]
MDTSPPLLLSSPADVLAAVPYLLGFHPGESLVVIGLTGDPPGGRLCLTTRWDLPLDPDAVPRLASLLAREGVTQVIVAGYGPGAEVTPAVDAVRAQAGRSGLTVAEALRADGGRFWSYLCADAGCCPPEGTPYDPAAGEVPGQAEQHGMTALRDRPALAGTLDPCTGPARRAMREATARVAAETIGRARACRDADALAAEFVADGIARVRAAVAGCADRRLSDEEAARLGAALSVIRVRDEAWTLIDDDRLKEQLDLWADLTRRLEPRFTPPAAALLGLTAWRAGDGALAGIALERALSVDPGYSMARLLMHALAHFLSPGLLTERMPSPADLDAAMGAPRMSWLLPLIAILDEEAA